MQGQWFSIGDGVTFRLRHVECPDLSPLLEYVGPDLRVVGQIVCLSDSGERKDHFAIVDVEGMHTPLIVPSRRLRPTRRCAGAASVEAGSAEPGPRTQSCGLPAGEQRLLRRLDP